MFKAILTIAFIVHQVQSTTINHRTGEMTNLDEASINPLDCLLSEICNNTEMEKTLAKFEKVSYRDVNFEDFEQLMTSLQPALHINTCTNHSGHHTKHQFLKKASGNETNHEKFEEEISKATKGLLYRAGDYESHKGNYPIWFMVWNISWLQQLVHNSQEVSKGCKLFLQK